MFKKKCPICGAKNDKERMACMECGSTFALRQAERQVSHVSTEAETQVEKGIFRVIMDSFEMLLEPQSTGIEKSAALKRAYRLLDETRPDLRELELTILQLSTARDEESQELLGRLKRVQTRMIEEQEAKRRARRLGRGRTETRGEWHR